METISIVNMTEICRLCLSEEGVGVPIFGGEEDSAQGGTSLPARIMTCASLEVHVGDGLPPLICLRCMYQVDQSYKFRVQCQRSDATLRRHFNLKLSISQQDSSRPSQSHALELSLQPQHQSQHQSHSLQHHPALHLPPGQESQRSRDKRLGGVRVSPAGEVEMLNSEQENGSVTNLKPRERATEEPAASSHLSQGPDRSVHSKSSSVSGFLSKRSVWPESHDVDVVSNGTTVNVVYQQVSLLKQESASEMDPDEKHLSKSKQYASSTDQSSRSREEHLLSELGSLGATALSKSPNNFAAAMYGLKALTGEHQFSCEICGRSFVQNHSLTRHMRTHTGERPYPCTTCGKAFIQNHSLTRHMRTHTGERPFPCPTCGRSFAEHHKLKSHVKTHTGERPYACETCGKTFIERHTLLDHMKTHTGERNYACAICGKSFMERHKLKRHLRSHTGERPYSCGTCGKSFVQSHNLTQHMRIHTGEQPFPCSACGKMFGERHKLERHLRSHAKNGPYACPTCGKRFVQSHRLARHVRLHAAEAAHGAQNMHSSQGPGPGPAPPQPHQGPPGPSLPSGGRSPQQPLVQAILHHPLVLPITLPVRSHFMKDMT